MMSCCVKMPMPRDLVAENRTRILRKQPLSVAGKVFAGAGSPSEGRDQSLMTRPVATDTSYGKRGPGQSL